MGNVGGGTVAGQINQSGGTVTTTGQAAEGNGIRLGHWPNSNVSYNLSGGTLTVGGGFALSTATDGTGRFTQTGGVANVTRVDVNTRNNANGNGTFEVNGGTFNLGAGGIVKDIAGAPATVNLGGGTIRATANWNSSLNMNVTGVGGATVIDTNGFNVRASGSISGAGQSLDKIGAGNLTLTGATNSFGTLDAAGGNLVLAGSSSTTVTNTRVGVSPGSNGGLAGSAVAP